MSGLVLAFEKYQYRGGIYNSPWIGLQNFKAIMIDGKLPGVTRGKTGLIFSAGEASGFPADSPETHSSPAKAGESLLYAFL